MLHVVCVCVCVCVCVYAHTPCMGMGTYSTCEFVGSTVPAAG